MKKLFRILFGISILFSGALFQSLNAQITPSSGGAIGVIFLKPDSIQPLSGWREYLATEIAYSDYISLVFSHTLRISNTPRYLKFYSESDSLWKELKASVSKSEEKNQIRIIVLQGSTLGNEFISHFPKPPKPAKKFFKKQGIPMSDPKAEIADMIVRLGGLKINNHKIYFLDQANIFVQESKKENKVPSASFTPPAPSSTSTPSGHTLPKRKD